MRERGDWMLGSQHGWSHERGLSMGLGRMGGRIITRRSRETQSSEPEPEKRNRVYFIRAGTHRTIQRERKVIFGGL